jgi:hypothetical protein
VSPASGSFAAKIFAPKKSGPAACAAGPLERGLAESQPVPLGQDENWKIVVEVKVCPALSSVDGNSGWFGESGKCWVSNV